VLRKKNIPENIPPRRLAIVFPAFFEGAMPKNPAPAAPTSPLKVEEWPIERFRDYERNPRKNDDVVDRMMDAIRVRRGLVQRDTWPSACSVLMVWDSIRGSSETQAPWCCDQAAMR
jgi:hypothetical protein